MVTKALPYAAKQQAAMSATAGVPRWLIALLLLAAVAPFLFVAIPPLVDLPGHMGRYHIAATIDRSPFLAKYYEYDWLLTGNLGVDLIVYALRDVIDVQRATWGVSLAIVVIVFAGIIATSRALHGEVQPHALLALPFIYSWMFLYGFLNYFLSAGLALLVFALWLRLAERPWIRAGMLLVLGLLVWLCHIVGWGILGVLIGTHLLHQGWTRHGRQWWPLLRGTALQVAPLLPPLLITLLWRVHSGGMGEVDYSNLPLIYKAKILTSILHDQSFALDVATLVAIWLIASRTYRTGQAVFHRGTLIAGAGLALIAVLMPARMFGSFYADARILPVAIIICLLGLRWTGPARGNRTVVVLACAIFLVRMAVTTAGWAATDSAIASRLAALDHVPMGARILVQVQATCRPPLWGGEISADHLGSMAIVRRDAFVNTQWQTVGAHPVRAIYNRDTPYFEDPSQFVRLSDCPNLQFRTLQDAMPWARRDHFDYLWIFHTSYEAPVLPAGLRTVYRDEDSLLLAIER